MAGNTCKICNESYYPFISFGKMPIANGFLDKSAFEDEYFFDMEAGVCPSCNMFQLVNQPEREKMFNENYAFFSKTSQGMTLHFKNFADGIRRKFLASSDPFVVEIGSNDGIMLQNFADAGIRHLGVEPSANVADVARESGINTVSEFFDENLAESILNEYGPADAIIAANVMCHIPYLHSIVEGMRVLLKKDGVVVFEDPYLGDVLENTSYDQIYDEHVFLFSLTSIKYLFEKHGMELFDVEPQGTHGGSMRYYISSKGTRTTSRRLLRQLEKERELGLDRPETYEEFRRNCERSRRDLMMLLEKTQAEGKRIAGYAATSKSTTIINYCGINSSHIEYICDTTPIKHGKFSPGAHIPVVPHERFSSDYPDYALLFAYNHEKEIMMKEKGFMAKGSKWIMYVPQIHIKG